MFKQLFINYKSDNSFQLKIWNEEAWLCNVCLMSSMTDKLPVCFDAPIDFII